MVWSTGIKRRVKTNAVIKRRFYKEVIMNQDNKIAIITARGGSKRIPRKNIKEFLGRPIIEYSIEAAIHAGIYDEIMVSTDDEEIAEIAQKAGAKIPFMRSESTSGDFATTADVLLEVFDWYQRHNKTFEYASCIYPTAPFVTADKLKEGMRILIEKQGGILIPVVKFSFPPQRSMVKRGGFLVSRWPEYYNSRSQDLESFYHDCGQFYCYNVNRFIACHGLFTDKIVPMVLSDLEVQDIDNEEDWKIAEIKFLQMQKRLMK